MQDTENFWKFENFELIEKFRKVTNFESCWTEEIETIWRNWKILKIEKLSKKW
jgi:hypothetical protein